MRNRPRDNKLLDCAGGDRPMCPQTHCMDALESATEFRGGTCRNYDQEIKSASFEPMARV